MIWGKSVFLVSASVGLDNFAVVSMPSMAVWRSKSVSAFGNGADYTLLLLLFSLTSSFLVFNMSFR